MQEKGTGFVEHGEREKLMHPCCTEKRRRRDEMKL